MRLARPPGGEAVEKVADESGKNRSRSLCLALAQEALNLFPHSADASF
jgi:hypothetical protein